MDALYTAITLHGSKWFLRAQLQSDEVLYTNPQGSGLSGEMFYSQTLAFHRNLKPQRGKCTLCVQDSKKEKGEAGDKEEDDPGH